ncbi:sugar transferase [Halobacillus sp. SY10]|uniref:sugar transferase n=1 Tax=Halobacillus sp. SY10 TaxID=3381356 RepID=UPI00387974F4
MTQLNTKQSTSMAYNEVESNDSVKYLVIKRLLDIIGATLGIIMLSPLFLLVSVFIKVEDVKGPILFDQIRIGKDGKKFRMYKFRSMVSNAEELKAALMAKNEAKGPVFKIREDPRITKVGKFIRRTSIDELPQLINVLKGDMSLVGPRPPLPNEVVQYSKRQRQRLSVTPGLTCYWQVSGRSNIGFDEWVEMDLEYIKNRSLTIDIKLILKTCIVIIGAKDAY